MRGKLWLALVLAPVLMASQCYSVVDVEVEPGAAGGDAPTFGFEFRGDVLTRLETFTVRSCTGDRDPTVWQLERTDAPDTETEPLRITYGRLPRGYRETRPAPPLEPGGCYRANAVAVDQPAPLSSTLGGETFRLLPNRRLVLGEPGGVLLSTRPFRQLNRASVGCTRGWRRARTAADSAAVSSREYTVLDARVSCEWLFSHWPDVATDPASTERVALATASLLVVYVTLGLLSEQIPELPQ